MGAQPLHDDDARQLALYGRTKQATPPAPPRVQEGPRLCAACRAHEARYVFQERADDDPLVGRPKTLCFECFRMEIDRRQALAAHRARGWNATQVELPLAGKIDELRRRRGRAQIAARRALGIR